MNDDDSKLPAPMIAALAEPGIVSKSVEQTESEVDSSLTLPRLQSWYIERDSVLDNLQFLLGQGAFVVYLESDPGYGKTVALAQFARRHRNDALVLFARKDDLVLGQPDSLRRDLYEQCQRILGDQSISEATDVDSGLLRTAYMRITKKARLRRVPQLVIVDGLNHYTSADVGQLSALQELMPISPDNFQFVISARPNQRVLPKIPDDRVRVMPMPMLHGDEIRQILAPFGLNDEKLRIYQRLSNGSPNKVASFRRRLLAGGETGRSTADPAPSDDDLFAEEFAAAESATEAERMVLAILAADNRPRSAADLALLTGASLAEIKALPGRYTFLSAELQDGTMDFAVEGLRKFAAQQLRLEMPRAYDILIAEASRGPQDIRTLATLPFYYAERQQNEALLAHLSPDYFGAVLAEKASLGLVRKGISYGLSAAQATEHDNELLRFAIYGSAVQSLGNEAAWRSEVRAFISLDDYDGALRLAQKTATPEERLRLLAAVSRARNDKGLPPDLALEADIRGLSDVIDPEVLGSNVYEVSSDLFASQPGIAIELVERSGKRLGRRRARDWGLVRLAVEAAKGDGDVDGAEQVYDRIKDPEARRFAYEVAAMLANRSGAQVRALSERLSEPSERISILAVWLRNNGARPDAVEVAEYALELAIATKVFSVSAAFLVDAARPLQARPLTDRHARLSNLIEGQAEGAKSGPTLEVVSLRLALASYEFAVNEAVGGERFLDVLLFVDAVADPTIRANGYARILSALHLLPPNNIVDANLQLSWQAVQNIRRDMTAVLEGSADHYRIAAPIVEQLWGNNPLLAEDIARQLNTRDRRDLTLRDLMMSMIVEAKVPPAMTTIMRIYGAIGTRELKDQVLLGVADRIRRDLLEKRTATMDHLWLVTEAKNMLSAAQKCRVAAEVLRASPNDIVTKRAKSLLRESWDSINVVWTKVEIGFRVASEIAEVDPELARQFVDMAEDERKGTVFGSRAVTESYELAVRLVIRAFGAFVAHKMEGELEPAEKAIRTLIDRIPVDGIKARLWAQVALAYFRNGDESRGQRVVSEFVRTHVEGIRRDDARFYAAVMVNVAPAIFLAQQSSTIGRLAALPDPQNDKALGGIVTYLFRKVPVSEPCDTAGSKPIDISWVDAESACDVLERVNDDALLWSRLGEISEALAARPKRDQFSREERNSIVSRMERLVTRLPLPGGIQHIGPEILSRSYILVAKGSTAGSPAWRALASETATIPNVADRALVRYLLAEHLPTSESATRESLLELARDDIAATPSLTDRIERLIGLAQVVRAKEKQCAFLREAMTLLRQNDGARGALQTQNRIIDAAHRIDEDFAAELVQEMDNDSAKAGPRREAKRRLQVLNLNKRLGKPAKGPTTSGALSATEYSDAARMSLAALNAKRRLSVKLGREGREALAGVAGTTLQTAYWVFAWLIENLAKSTDTSPAFRDGLRGLFLATVQGADLIVSFADRAKVQGPRAPDSSSGTSSIIVGAREREKAYKFVGEWLRKQQTNSVVFYDPFFGPEDLDFVQIVQSCHPDARIVVVTSLKAQTTARVPVPYAETYARAWRELSDIDPPDCEIKIIGLEPAGEAPFHDRCILVDDSAFDLGPSWNGIGIGRIGKLGEMNADVVHEAFSRLMPFVNRSARSYDGKRLLFRGFTLSQ